MKSNFEKNTVAQDQKLSKNKNKTRKKGKQYTDLLACAPEFSFALFVAAKAAAAFPRSRGFRANEEINGGIKV